MSRIADLDIDAFFVSFNELATVNMTRLTLMQSKLPVVTSKRNSEDRLHYAELLLQRSEFLARILIAFSLPVMLSYCEVKVRACFMRSSWLLFLTVKCPSPCFSVDSIWWPPQLSS